MPAFPFTEVSSPHVDAWMLTPPRVPGDLDEGALLRISMALSDIGAAEYSAALLKMLAVTNAAPAVDLDDEAIFAASQRLREAFYLEIMQYRRAVLRDVDAGSAHD